MPSEIIMIEEKDKKYSALFCGIFTALMFTGMEVEEAIKKTKESVPEKYWYQ